MGTLRAQPDAMQGMRDVQFLLKKIIPTSTDGQIKCVQNISMGIRHGKLAHNLIDQDTITPTKNTSKKSIFQVNSQLLGFARVSCMDPRKEDGPIK